MIHTDGTPTVASRTTAIDRDVKKALRLKRLAPITYRRLLRQRPDIRAKLAERGLL